MCSTFGAQEAMLLLFIHYDGSFSSKSLSRGGCGFSERNNRIIAFMHSTVLSKRRLPRLYARLNADFTTWPSSSQSLQTSRQLKREGFLYRTKTKSGEKAKLTWLPKEKEREEKQKQARRSKEDKEQQEIKEEKRKAKLNCVRYLSTLKNEANEKVKRDQDRTFSVTLSFPKQYEFPQILGQNVRGIEDKIESKKAMKCDH